MLIEPIIFMAGLIVGVLSYGVVSEYQRHMEHQQQQQLLKEFICDTNEIIEEHY